MIEKGQVILVGFSFFGDPFQLSGEWREENEIGRLWQRFMTYMAHHGDQIKHLTNKSVCYEVHIEHEETPLKGHYEIFVGIEVEQLEDIPVDVLMKILPPTTYAVFTLKGQQIASDWSRMVYYDWLPGSGYQVAYNYGFQLYDHRFKGLQNLDESELDIYIPVKSR